jgi:hypothetical protein
MQMLRNKARALVWNLREPHALLKREKIHHQDHHHQQEALKSLFTLLLLKTNKDLHDLVLPPTTGHKDLTAGLPLLFINHPHLPDGADHKNPPNAKHPSNLHVHDGYASNLLTVSKSYSSTALNL